MGVFQDIKLEWNGEAFTVPSNRVMGAIAIIEEHVTLKELYESVGRGTAKLSKLASAYGGVLRYAGAKVQDEDVYAGMFDSKAAENVSAAVAGLLSMMIPPNVEKNPKGKLQPAEGLSSPQRSKRRSALSA